jgi:hypothetical protein
MSLRDAGLGYLPRSSRVTQMSDWRDEEQRWGWSCYGRTSSRGARSATPGDVFFTRARCLSSSWSGCAQRLRSATLNPMVRIGETFPAVARRSVIATSRITNLRLDASRSSPQGATSWVDHPAPKGRPSSCSPGDFLLVRPRSPSQCGPDPPVRERTYNNAVPLPVSSTWHFTYGLLPSGSDARVRLQRSGCSPRPGVDHQFSCEPEICEVCYAYGLASSLRSLSCRPSALPGCRHYYSHKPLSSSFRCNYLSLRFHTVCSWLF